MTLCAALLLFTKTSTERVGPGPIDLRLTGSKTIVVSNGPVLLAKSGSRAV